MEIHVASGVAIPVYMRLNSFFIVCSVALAPFIYNPAGYVRLLTSVNVGLGIASVLMWLLESRLEILGYGLVGRIFAAWTVIISMSLFMGIAWSTEGIGEFLSRAFQYDLKYLLFTASAFMYIRPKYRHVVPRIMLWAAIVGIAYGVISLLTSSYDLQSLLLRSNTWKQQYYYWWALSLGPFLYFYGKWNRVRVYQLIGMAYLVLYVMVGLLATKRVALIYALCWALTPLLVPKKTLGLNKSGSIASGRRVIGYASILAVAILAYVLTPLIGSWMEIGSYTVNRFSNVSDESRIGQYGWIFSNSSPLQLLLGRGVGAFDPLRPSVNGLEVGWANLVFKAGVPLMLLYAVVFSLPLFRRKMVAERSLEVYYGCGLWYFVVMFVEGGWGQIPIIFPALYSALVVIYESGRNILPHATTSGLLDAGAIGRTSGRWTD